MQHYASGFTFNAEGDLPVRSFTEASTREAKFFRTGSRPMQVYRFIVMVCNVFWCNLNHACFRWAVLIESGKGEAYWYRDGFRNGVMAVKNIIGQTKRQSMTEAALSTAKMEDGGGAAIWKFVIAGRGWSVNRDLLM